MQDFFYVLVYAIIFFTSGFLAWFWSATTWKRFRSINGSWRTLWHDRYWMYTFCFALIQLGLLLLTAGRTYDNFLKDRPPSVELGNGGVVALILTGLVFLLGSQMVMVRVAALEVPPLVGSWVIGAACTLGFAATIAML